MTDEEIAEIAIKGEKAAFLIGQLTGGLVALRQSCSIDGPTTQKLDELIALSHKSVKEIYYSDTIKTIEG